MNKQEALEMCIKLWDGIADHGIGRFEKAKFANSLFGMRLTYACPCCEYAQQENAAAGAVVSVDGMCDHCLMWPTSKWEDEAGNPMHFACERGKTSPYRVWRANPCEANARAVADQARETLRKELSK